MNTYRIIRDNGIDLEFSAEIIGFAEGSQKNIIGYHIDSTTLTTLLLYKTAGGKYICEKITQNDTYPSKNKSRAIVSSGATQIYKFFGTGALATQLYKMAALPVQFVD